MRTAKKSGFCLVPCTSFCQPLHMLFVCWWRICTKTSHSWPEGKLSLHCTWPARMQQCWYWFYLKQLYSEMRSGSTNTTLRQKHSLSKENSPLPRKVWQSKSKVKSHIDCFLWPSKYDSSWVCSWRLNCQQRVQPDCFLMLTRCKWSQLWWSQVASDDWLIHCKKALSHLDFSNKTQCCTHSAVSLLARCVSMQLLALSKTPEALKTIKFNQTMINVWKSQ